MESGIYQKYLEERKKEKSVIQVHLVNGVKLVGMVKEYDGQWLKIGMPHQRSTVINLANVTSLSLGAPKDMDEPSGRARQ